MKVYYDSDTDKNLITDYKIAIIGVSDWDYVS